MATQTLPVRRAPRTVSPERQRHWLRLWLFAVAALVLVMVTVGGATRLTGSGLSITEWRPILGAIPPLSDADWMTAFNKYRQIEQYKRVNAGMSLDAFKVIYWWEWGHRQLGRGIGLAFAVPLAIFLLRGWVPKSLAPKLWGLLVLGGLQGAMGWYMVQSGLTDRVDVSQYRLAAHLTLAAVIFAALLWLAFDLGRNNGQRVRLKTLPARACGTSRLLLWLMFGQIALGALVAGMKAGLSHNTWPLMDGRIIPNGLFAMSPWWVNVFENALTVQFDHRLLAYVLAGLGLWHAWRVARVADDERVRLSAMLLGAAIVGQIALGIWTLLAFVPLSLGLAHQAFAMIVLGIAVWHRHAVVHG